jgi:hypothetical protein
LVQHLQLTGNHKEMTCRICVHKLDTRSALIVHLYSREVTANSKMIPSLGHRTIVEKVNGGFLTVAKTATGDLAYGIFCRRNYSMRL